MKVLLLKFWPVLFILTVWFIFAAPYYLFNKTPFPSSFLVNSFSPWNAYPGVAGPIKNNATPDVITQIYPWKKLVIDSWREGQIPLWNPYSFSGTPLLANYQSAALSPINIMYFILPFIESWNIQVLLQPLLAGIFMYIFARCLKLKEIPSLISALSYMFCGFITTWMVYGTLGYAILFLPLALFAIEKFYQTGKRSYLIILSLTIPLSFFSGHFQTSLYFLLFVIAYCFFKFIQTRDFKPSIYYVLSIIFGLLISAPQLLPSVELYFASLRSELFLKTEVIPWTYLPTFIAPDFYGNPVTRNDWFGHYAEWNAYIGSIPFILAFYALRRRSAYIIFFVMAAAFTLLLAFQTPILDLLISLKIPVISTSAASRIIVLFSFAASILAGFGFQNLFLDIREKKIKPILIWLSGAFLVFIILWSLITFKLFIPADKLLISFSNMRLPTLMFFSLCIFVVASLFIKNKNFAKFLPLILIAIIAFDVLRFSSKWQPSDSKEQVYPNVPVSKFLSSIGGFDRALGNYGADASIAFGLPSVEGYDPLYIERYGEFIEAVPDAKFHRPQRSVVSFPKNGRFAATAINLLGVKYIIHKVSDGNAVWTFPFWEYPVDTFKLIYKDDSYQVFENQKVFPRAFIAGDYKSLNSDKGILKAVFKDSDLRKQIILSDELNLEKGGSGSALIKSYSANEVLVDTETKGNSILFLSDPFYPGWKVEVDKIPAKIHLANYAFRAVEVPEGKHTITFKYDPMSFKIGVGLAIVGLAGTAGLAIRKK